MGYKLGATVGFGVGYYLGAKAGRARYVQLEQWLQRALSTEVVESAFDKARAVADLGVERARDLLEQRAEGPDAVSP